MRGRSAVQPRSAAAGPRSGSGRREVLRGQRGENPVAKRSGNRASDEDRRAGERAQTERAPMAFTASGTAARDWAQPVAVTVETEAQLAEVLKHDAVALVYLDEACFTDFAALIRRLKAGRASPPPHRARFRRERAEGGKQRRASEQTLEGGVRCADDRGTRAQCRGARGAVGEQCRSWKRGGCRSRIADVCIRKTAAELPPGRAAGAEP